ncbi:MAG: serine hydrolase [Bacteroidia bacterium]|nr:serine hydrolase [Bacteroidia bacterium]
MNQNRTLKQALMWCSLALLAAAQRLPAQPYAFVANTLSNNVSVLDLATGTVDTTFGVGTVPVDIAPSPDGSQFAVVNATSGTISLVDAATYAVTATFPVSGIPSDALYSPDGTTLYVSFLSLNEVRAYSLPAGTLLTTIPFAGGPTDMALRPGTNLIYTLRSSLGELGVIDASTHTVTATNIVLEGLLGANSSNPFAIRITPDGSKAVVPNSSAFYSNVVNLNANTASRVQQFGFDAFMNGSIEVAITPGGDTALITQEAGGVLSVVDLNTNSIVSDIFFGPTDQPIGVAVSPDGSTAYVALTASDAVAIVDLAAGTFTTVAVGDAPRDIVILSAAQLCPPVPDTAQIAATIVAGGSYLFDGVLRTSSGVYTSAVYPNSEGCDSVAQLTLTVVPAASPALSAYLQTVLDQSTLSSGGLSASVLSNGTVAALANGFADVGTPAQPGIKFGLSDISQHLMAVLTLRLAEEGVITLGTALGALPNFPNNPNDIPQNTTIEQLLRHTSGINTYNTANYRSPALSILFGNLAQDWSTANYAQIVQSYVFPQPNAVPGTFKYSPTNFLLLGEKLEQATGQSLQSLLDTYVLAPAGIGPMEFWKVPNPANSSTYYFNLSGLGIEALSDQTSVLTSTGASGSIVAAPEVIALYMRALFSGQILSQASLNQLMSFNAITGRPSNAYGMGTERFPLTIGGNSYDFTGHVGDVNYSAALIYSPVLNAGAFVSSNNDAVPQDTVLEIARRLIEAALNPPCPPSPVTEQTADTVCSSALPYLFNGASLTAAGVYSDTLTTAGGCDSIIVLTLTVNPALNSALADTVCANQLPYAFGSQSVTAAGVYTEVFQTAAGCDSTVALTLTVLPVPPVNAFSLTVCSNSLPYPFGTQSLTAAGVYSETFEAANGCDSTAVLTLTVGQVYQTAVTDTIISGQSYVFGSQTLTAAGTYTNTFASAQNCDSAVTLTLVVLPQTGIGDELGARLRLKLSPNPAGGTLRAEFELPAAGEVQIEVRNALGQTVLREAPGVYGAGRQAVTLRLGELPAGVYYVHLRNGAIQASQPFLAQP